MNNEYFVRPRRVYLGAEGSWLEKAYDRISEYMFRFCVHRCPQLYSCFGSVSSQDESRAWQIVNFVCGLTIGSLLFNFLIDRLFSTAHYSTGVMKQLFAVLFALLYSLSKRNRAIIYVYPIVVLSMSEAQPRIRPDFN
jgi:sugar phosphate permease